MKHTDYVVAQDEIEHLKTYNYKDGIRVSATELEVKLTGSISSRIGGRDNMEDTEVSFYSKESIDSEKLKLAIQNSINSIMDKAKTREFKSGSCVNLTAVNSKLEAVCANMGDSYSIAFVWNCVTKKVKATLLNNIHSPKRLAGKQNISYEIFSFGKDGSKERISMGIYNGIRTDRILLPEIEQIKKSGKTPSFIYRLRGQLSVGSAINHNIDGVVLEPEIMSTDLNSLCENEGDRIFLCTTCDGLFETPFQTLSNYTLLFEDAINRGAEDTLADLMCNFAQFGTNKNKSVSHDNLTAICVEIPRTNKNFTYFQGVFDGHGGSEVAELLKSEIQSLLELNLDTPLLKSCYFNRYSANLDSAFTRKPKHHFNQLCNSCIPNAMTGAEIMLAGVVVYSVLSLLMAIDGQNIERS